MKKITALFALITILVLSGCASVSNQMTPVQKPIDKPTSKNKSLVIFLRPSLYGGLIQSTLYDGLKYIGTLSAKTQIAYQTRPGKHMFMVVGESADFMRATLLPNKTYYAIVAPRMGSWKARFSFRPQNGQIPQDNLNHWLLTTNQVRINAQGLSWYQANKTDVLNKRAEYFPEWLGKSKAQQDQATLWPSSGK